MKWETENIKHKTGIDIKNIHVSCSQKIKKRNRKWETINKKQEIGLCLIIIDVYCFSFVFNVACFFFL